MKKRYMFLFVVIVFVLICLCLFTLENSKTPEPINLYEKQEEKVFSTVDSIEYLMKIKDMNKLYFSEEEMIKFIAFKYKDSDIAKYIEEENKVIIGKGKMIDLLLENFLREINFETIQNYIKDENIEVVLEAGWEDLNYELIETWYESEGEYYISKYQDKNTEKYYELGYNIYGDQVVYISLREIKVDK